MFFVAMTAFKIYPRSIQIYPFIYSCPQFHCPYTSDVYNPFVSSKVFLVVSFPVGFFSITVLIIDPHFLHEFPVSFFSLKFFSVTLGC